jgi:hypothetical protein
MRSHDETTDRHGRVVAAAVLAAYLACLAALATMHAIAGGLGEDSVSLAISDLLWVSPFLPFPVVGALILARRPHNRIGWLLSAIGLSLGIGLVGDEYARHGMVTAPGAVPLPEVALLLGSGIILAFPLILLLIVVFPDGRLLSARWRWPVLAGLTAFGLVTLSEMVSPETPFEVPGASPLNPWAVPVVHGLIEAVAPALTMVMVLFALTALASPVVRFRRSRGVERQQLKWLAVAVVLVPVANLAVGALREVGLLSDELAGLFGWALPGIGISVAIAVAVLRYRLYEIDRIVSRSVAYAVVTGVLVGVYAGTVMLLGQVLAPLTRQSDVAVAASTLLVAALFQPVRRGVQSVVDRRFNRARYDAQRTVEDFAARLRDEVDLDDLHHELGRVVAGTVQPASLSLWLRTERP